MSSDHDRLFQFHQWHAHLALDKDAPIPRAVMAPGDGDLVGRHVRAFGEIQMFAFHDNEEIGPRMLARVARRTGLTPADL